MKNYFLILLTVFGISILATPNISASKESEIDFDKTSEVETLPEITAISEAKIEDIAENANIPAPVYTTPKTSQRTEKSTPSILNYTVTRYLSRVEADPGNFINQAGKLIYAHNDPALMLSALSLRPGSIFTVTTNNTTKTYQVAETQIFSKDELARVIPGTNSNLMGKIAYSGQNQNGVRYSIVLMTCYERTRGAAHRFVVFANEI